MKLDRKLCEAIETLRPHPAFETLQNAIREDVKEAYEATGTAEGTPLFRAQGKIKALRDLLEAFEKARELLDKPHFK